MKLQFSLSMIGLNHIWAIDTVTTAFQICSEIVLKYYKSVPSAIVLILQARSALIDPQAFFPGTY